MIALLALWYGGWGYREWRWEWTLSRAVGHLASGVAVGVAEEVIFRGFFFLAVCRVLVPRGGWAVGLAGSAVFASVHFFIDVRDRSGVPDWSSGWELWAQWAGLFLSPTQFLTRWLGLFLAGLVLCALVARHGHVWGAVALHAGWVFALKSVHRLSRGSGEPSLWFAPDLLSGLWASLLLAVILGVLLRGNPGLRVRADGAPRNAGDG
jgi:membrane protease YdiL (CAAX protease family)